jgi:hypothetical protein
LARAFDWQSKGQGFDSPNLHLRPPKPWRRRASLLLQDFSGLRWTQSPDRSITFILADHIESQNRASICIFVSEMESRTLFLIVLFQLVFLTAVAQGNKKDAQLKNLEASVANARARVALNEKKVADADSIINSGKKMIDESKTEAKSVDSDSRQLEKDYAARRNSLVKLTKSKEKAEANRAKTELRALETGYKASNRILETRLRDATKKQTTGIANIQKGRTSRKNAMDALKVSNNTLKAVQKKYDAAAGSADKKPDQEKKRN